MCIRDRVYADHPSALGDLAIVFVEPLQILQCSPASIAHLSLGYFLFFISHLLQLGRKHVLQYFSQTFVVLIVPLLSTSMYRIQK